MSNTTYKSNFTGDPKQHDVSKFSESMTGTCLCGSISVTINDKELFGDKSRGHLWHVIFSSSCDRVANAVQPLRQLSQGIRFFRVVEYGNRERKGSL
jgi:hypothetical protein